MKIVFAAGGTGGHFIPAMSVAREIKKANPGVHLLFMGTGKHFELEACKKEGIEHMKIPSGPLRRGTVVSNILLPFETFFGILCSSRKMIEMRSDVLVSMGGYPSIPPFFSARLLGLPTIVHEQNAEPGVASRLEAYFTEEMCLSYNITRGSIKGKGRVTVTGNPSTPSREEVEEARKKRKSNGLNLLVMGGSQGAHALNEVVTKYLLEAGASSWERVYFQTGQADYEAVRTKLSGLSEKVVVKPFFHEMRDVYTLVDVAVTRAGATTIAELSGWGIPAVLVPYPYSAGGHQKKNAEMMDKAGAAYVVEQQLFNHRRLERLLESMIQNTKNRDKMSAAASSLARHDAARDVALKVLNLASAGRRRRR
jgi:UDP-N-acetylglucosamine--N-acetylmuramyl-(pentapeptide) pyrophosphoryl-undecaprenol N-acetylglucosamine transferase